MASDDDLRIRLEGGVELLEATRLRYRSLVAALSAFLWKERLRRLSDVLRETAKAQRAVDEVIALVHRRAQAEAWPEGEVLAVAREVRELRTRLRALVERRLGDSVSHVLADDLIELEARAVTAPRLVLPGRRWSTACEVLPASLDELGEARTLAETLKAAFGSPGEVKAERWAEVEARWPHAVAAVDRAWSRVERIDVSGGLARTLRRRARRLPRFTPEQATQGPAALITAEYWRTLALERITHIVSTAVMPARPKQPERWPVFAWLVRHPTDAMPLEHPSMSPARSALLELAFTLAGSAGARTVRPFARLRELGARADLDPTDDDWVLLRDALALLVRVAATPSKWLPPVYRTPEALPAPRAPARTLGALVDRLELSLTQNKQ